MFSFLSKSSDLKNPLRGFKIARNNDRNRKVGIAANSLETLRKKIGEKFKMKKFDLFLSDGILLDDEDYFASVPAQAVIVVAEEGEEVKSDQEIILESFCKINHEILHARELIRDLVTNNPDSDVIKAISHLQNEIEARIKISSRVDDPEWFEGLEPKITTKEELMRRKSQDRIRGYFYKTKDELTKSRIYKTNAKARKIVDDLLTDFFLFLNGVEYFSCLFDRSHSEKFELKTANDETDAQKFATTPKRRRIDSETKAKLGESEIFRKLQVALCNDVGNFDCHGYWNAKSCGYNHKINPYSSRESVVLFSMYNLDHQIEISRSIFPSILKNIEGLFKGENCSIHDKKGEGLSVLTYFKEIFTVKNLKLVHVVCHDKATHDELKSKGRIVCKDCDEFKKIQKIKLKIS